MNCISSMRLCMCVSRLTRKFGIRDILKDADFNAANKVDRRKRGESVRETRNKCEFVSSGKRFEDVKIERGAQIIDDRVTGLQMSTQEDKHNSNAKRGAHYRNQIVETVNKSTSKNIKFNIMPDTEIEEISARLVEQNTPENIHFPWTFSSFSDIRSPQVESNLNSIFPYTSIFTPQLLNTYFRSFIRYLVDQDWDLLEDYVEPAFLKSVQRELGLMPSRYSLQARNFRSCISFFDLYDIRNIFMSDVNVNRRKADGMDHFEFTFKSVNDAPLYIMNKKRPGNDDQCGLIMQFHVNVYTDLDLQVVDDKGQVMMRDDNIVQFKSKDPRSEDRLSSARPHRLVLEILACKGSYSEIHAQAMSAVQTGKMESKLISYMSKHNFRIIDIDNFMNGNPLLVGLNWPKIQSLIDKEDDLSDISP